MSFPGHRFNGAPKLFKMQTGRHFMEENVKKIIFVFSSEFFKMHAVIRDDYHSGKDTFLTTVNLCLRDLFS